MSVNSDINKILQIKKDIHTVIKDKGVDISSDTLFEEYPQKISNISGGGSSGYTYNCFNGSVQTSDDSVSYVNTTFNPEILPNYTQYNGESQYVLMSLTNENLGEDGKYKGVKALVPNANPYIVNEGVTITNGIASGFNNSNRIVVNGYDIDDWSVSDVTFRVTWNTDITGRNKVIYNSMSISPDGYLCIYTNEWKYGNVKLSRDVDYYIRMHSVKEENFIKMYFIEASNYTEDLSKWTLGFSYSGASWSGFQERTAAIGQNYWFDNEYFEGTIDLAHSNIIVDGKVIWEYPQVGIEQVDMYGCLNYEDDGSAKSVKAYCVKGNEDKIVLGNQPSIVGATVLELGNVSVPAHDLYSYSEQTDYSKFIKYGSVSLDTSTGVASNFSTSNYLRLDIPLQTTLNTWDICFKVTVPDGDVTPYGRVFQSGQSNDQLSFAVGTMGMGMRIFDSTDIILTNTLYRGTYYVRCTGDGSEGILYTSLDGVEWTQITYNSYNPTSVNIPFFELGARTYDSYEGCVFSGSIDLSKSYVKINGEYLYDPTKMIGVWTKK